MKTSAIRIDRLPIVASILLLVFASGCARYRYQLVEPDQFAQPIPDEASARVPYEPLEYYLTEYSDRLLIRISNPTEHPVIIQGEKSYVVDPRGATRSLTSATIAPRSFVDISLPPAPLLYQTYSSPRVTLGFGYDYGFGPAYRARWGHRYGYFYDPFWDPYIFEPPVRYYRVLTPEHWEWTVGEVRMRVAYQTLDRSVAHDFTFVRERVD